MKIPQKLFCVLFLLATGCSAETPSVTPTTTTTVLDSEATIEAAVAATIAAETQSMNTQATVDSAIATTGTAQASLTITKEAKKEATRSVEPTATFSPETLSMTEDELTQAINEASTLAGTATQQTADEIAAAASDGTITQEEVDSISFYLEDAELAIAYTEELVDAYFGLYADIAQETLYLLEEITIDLSTLSDSAVAIASTVEAMEETLAEGFSIDEDSIAYLAELAISTYDNANAIEKVMLDWQPALIQEIESNAIDVLAIPPNEIATSRRAALRMVSGYLELAQQAILDSSVSIEELTSIAQLGANTAASLDSLGGAQLEQLASSINQITSQMADGNLSQVQANLSGLKAAVEIIPSLP